MLIIVVSFIILAIAICSIVSNYVSAANQELVSRMASSAHDFLNEGFLSYKKETYGLGEFRYFVGRNTESIEAVFSSLIRLTGDDQTVIIITDAEGKILMLYGDDNNIIDEKMISNEVIENLKRDGGSGNSSDLVNVFKTTSTSQAYSVNTDNGEAHGYVIASIYSSWIGELNRVIMKTVIISSIWVLIASLIMVYYLTEHVIGPMRKMRIAAKKFSQGHFEARVPVKGSDEIAELALAFNNMASSLEKLEFMRSSFLANVSHDLRTPMTTISGFVDGILDGTITPDRQGHYLEIVSSEVKRLSRLVSSLLDISRMQAGEKKFVPVDFDICEMGRQILISFEQQLTRKNLDVEFETSSDKIMAFADKDAIHQVFYNLCHNAVKFSKEGGKYKVSIIENNKKIRVSVFNEGEGIQEDDIPYVFERFYKGDKSRGLDRTGAGLGLYIAKTIMNSHGEDLTVDSVYGEYCEFSFTLKCSSQQT